MDEVPSRGGAVEVRTTATGFELVGTRPHDAARLRSLAQLGLGAQADPQMQAVAERVCRWLDVPVALRIGKGTLRKMRQNLGWAIGYNAIALPIAAGVFEPAFGLVLRPEIAALTMSGSSLIVAVNALLLKLLDLPEPLPPTNPLTDGNQLR